MPPATTGVGTAVNSSSVPELIGFADGVSVRLVGIGTVDVCADVAGTDAPIALPAKTCASSVSPA